MIGSVNRKIGEFKVRNAQCEHCKTENTLVATIYSKLFLLKIIPFVCGKSASLSCNSCKKTYGNDDLVAKSTNQRIEILKEDANHSWIGYIGYAILGIGAIGAVLKEIQAVT